MSSLNRDDAGNALGSDANAAGNFLVSGLSASIARVFANFAAGLSEKSVVAFRLRPLAVASQTAFSNSSLSLMQSSSSRKNSAPLSSSSGGVIWPFRVVAVRIGVSHFVRSAVTALPSRTRVLVQQHVLESPSSISVPVSSHIHAAAICVVLNPPGSAPINFICSQSATMRAARTSSSSYSRLSGKRCVRVSGVCQSRKRPH